MTTPQNNSGTRHTSGSNAHPSAASGAVPDGSHRSDVGDAGAESEAAPVAPLGPRFLSRDLSWLEFNRRVMAQAEDDGVPLLERFRFLSIFTSNLDEFYMKRVGLIKRQVHAGVDVAGPDGLTPRQQLSAIRAMVRDLQDREHEVFSKQLIPALLVAGIELVAYDALTERERVWVNEWYRQHVFPALTPLAVDPTHRFPFISNLSDNLAVVASVAGRSPMPAPPPRAAMRRKPVASLDLNDVGETALFARVKLPPAISRLVRLPGERARFVSLPEVVRNNLDDLFPGMPIREQTAFRVTRMAGIQKDELDTGNLLQSVEADLKQRKFARCVRLEIEEGASAALIHWLRDKLNLDGHDVYERPKGLDILGATELCDLDRPDLKFKPWKGVVPPRLAEVASRAVKTPAAFFGAIRKKDILLHHPYESFNASVERFIASAASDPDVLTIKQTLYRTTPDSPFIESLMRAAEAGKQVACLVELRARFDESRNVRFARQLEKAGVHVAYGVMGLKTHCKTSLVVRKERSGLRCYAHIGTGNYHPKTAQLYTDVGLMTADPEITGDLVNLFNFLTGLAATQKFDHLLVAPFNMRERFNQMIERECEMARRGRPARIIAKFNSLEDRDITERLYGASKAGVKITLIVRGFCCLRPGVPGLSENIRVMSVVGRFLEHARIFHFASGHADPLDGEWLISSADWMYRNLSNRVEVALPVRDKEARARLHRIIQVHMADRRCAWDMSGDGTYERRSASHVLEAGAGVDGEVAREFGTFEALMQDAAAG